MAGIQGLMRVIVYVQNMEAQVKFYRDVLGLNVVSPLIDDYSQECWVVLNAGMAEVVLHGGGQKRLGADTPKMVFEVDDIETVRTKLIQHGVNMDEIFSPAPGVK